MIIFENCDVIKNQNREFSLIHKKKKKQIIEIRFPVKRESIFRKINFSPTNLNFNMATTQCAYRLHVFYSLINGRPKIYIVISFY